MSRDLIGHRSFALAALVAVGLLLLVTSPQAMAVNYTNWCKTTNIANSYANRGTQKFDIEKLQTQLQKGNYFAGKVNGKWNSRTEKALSNYCLELGTNGEKIPEVSKTHIDIELFKMLYDKANTIKPYKICAIETIESSFKASQPDENLIRNLQDLLRSDGFMQAQSSGKLDGATLDGLESFCLKVASKDKAMPKDVTARATGKLAEFLEDKLVGFVPESNDCAPAKIKASIEKLKPDAESIEAIRQRLVERKFLDASDSTSELGADDISALNKFCLEDAIGDPAIPHENLNTITPELAAFLQNKLLDPGKQDGEEKKPVDCGQESLESLFSHIGSGTTREIQQFLKTRGFLTDWADGVAGPETYHALARMCEFIDQGGEEGNGNTKPSAIETLAIQLKTGQFAELTATLQQRSGDFSLIAADSTVVPPAADCGCSRDFAANVYGFLPYWLADDQRRGVDFSMLDRVGIFGLQLDSMLSDVAPDPESFWRAGNQQDPDAGSHIARFLNAARRHRVAVDITFYTAAWRGWNVEDKTEKTRIVDAIESAYQLKFSDHRAASGLLSQLRVILPFVERDSNVGVNGINLYFDHYSNPDDADKIVAVVNALGERLPQTEVNLILGPNWSGIKRAATEGRAIQLVGIKPDLFSRLGDLFDDDSKVANLLVFLPRNTSHAEKNTSNAKKLLRRAIEEAFDGKGNIRRNMLRRTIPIVITYNDADQSPDYFDSKQGGNQFGEDLIYLQDNFDGVGLWPLPLLTPPPEQDDESNGDGEDNANDNGIGDSEDKANGNGDDDATTANSGSDSDMDSLNDGAAIANILLAQYEIEPDWPQGVLWQWLGEKAETVCQFACPNRWLFRLAFDFLAVVLVIYALTATVNCRLREFYQRNSSYFVGYGFVTALVFCVSLICDPFWQAVSDEVLIGVILALVAYLVWRKFDRSKQADYP